MRRGGNVAIDMSAKIDFHQLSVLKNNRWLGGKRREVADAIVDGHAGRHGDTLLYVFLLLVGLSGELQESVVAELAQLSNFCAFLGRCNHFLK